MLQNVFINLVKTYGAADDLASTMWQEVHNSHNQVGRYYHNLKHLENLYEELQQCNKQIQDLNTLLFSIIYHDIIYDATTKDNEEKSAAIAVERLTTLGCGKDIIAKCREQIIATKSHTLSTDKDTNLFTDADLSILGSKWEKYLQYSKQVREEYSMYADALYIPGRRKVLQHFLKMEHIFKTEHFRIKYENQARKNLVAELKLLA